MNRFLSYTFMGLLALVVVWWSFQSIRAKVQCPAGPESGFYRSSFRARFEGDSFSLQFEGKTASHWYWVRPDNFRYEEVSVEWFDQAQEHHASIKLPEFTYQFGNDRGVLTREVIADWTNQGYALEKERADSVAVNTLYEFLQAAAFGTLPPPRHHTYTVDEPLYLRFGHGIYGGPLGFIVDAAILACLFMIGFLWTHPKIWNALGRAGQRVWRMEV